MPRIGESTELKVMKIIASGAFLSDPKNTRESYFLHIKEASEEWIKSMEDIVEVGDMITARIIGTRKSDRSNTITYQVSLNTGDDETYKSEQFNERMEEFIKQSGEVQSQIRRNQNRKFDGRKPRHKRY